MLPTPNPTLDFVSLGVCTLCVSLHDYITVWYMRLANPTPAQTKKYRLINGISVYGFPVYLLAVCVALFGIFLF